MGWSCTRPFTTSAPVSNLLGKRESEDTPFGVNLTTLERGSKGQPPLCGVRGVPEKPLFLLLLAAIDVEEGEKKLGDTPNPGRETPAPLKLTPMGDTPRPGGRLRPLHSHYLTGLLIFH